LGFSSLGNYEEVTAKNQPGGVFNFYQDGAQKTAGLTCGSGIFPSIPPKQVTLSGWGNDSVALSQISGVFRGHISLVNTSWYGGLQEVWWWYMATTNSTVKNT
jgi:hypothetical protein